MAEEPISLSGLLLRWLDDKYPDAFRFSKREIYAVVLKDEPGRHYAVNDILPIARKQIIYEGLIERKVAVSDSTQSMICAFILNCGIICRTKDGKNSGINIMKPELFDTLDAHFQSWI